MSLSARLELGPSRRLTLLVTLVPAGGVLVGSVALAARWSFAAPWLAALAVGACGLLVCGVIAGYRRSVPWVMTLSGHRDFDIAPDPAAQGGSWRLAESTAVWPGFAIVALRKSDPSIASEVVRRPVLFAELGRDDRRSLNRFLLWSLRGGDGAESRLDFDATRP